MSIFSSSTRGERSGVHEGPSRSEEEEQLLIVPGDTKSRSTPILATSAVGLLTSHQVSEDSSGETTCIDANGVLHPPKHCL